VRTQLVGRLATLQDVKNSRSETDIEQSSLNKVSLFLFANVTLSVSRPGKLKNCLTSV
jgi:hypothetical protein